MLVIGLVAGIAGGFRILKGGAQVALLARCGCVQTYERKAGQVVVENHLGQPAALLVTPFTLFSLLATVNVVTGMAIVASE